MTPREQLWRDCVVAMLADGSSAELAVSSADTVLQSCDERFPQPQLPSTPPPVKERWFRGDDRSIWKMTGENTGIYIMFDGCDPVESIYTITELLASPHIIELNPATGEPMEKKA